MIYSKYCVLISLVFFLVAVVNFRNFTFLFDKTILSMMRERTNKNFQERCMYRWQVEWLVLLKFRKRFFFFTFDLSRYSVQIIIKLILIKDYRFYKLKSP